MLLKSAESIFLATSPLFCCINRGFVGVMWEGGGGVVVFC